LHSVIDQIANSFWIGTPVSAKRHDNRRLMPMSKEGASGYAAHVLFCLEIAMMTRYKEYGGWGTHVHEDIIPWLKSLGA
jgi:hypothetical protein